MAVLMPQRRVLTGDITPVLITPHVHHTLIYSAWTQSFTRILIYQTHLPDFLLCLLQLDRFMSYSNLYVMYSINSYQLQVAVSNKSCILTPNLLPTHIINPCIYKSVVDIETERLPLKGQVCEASSIDDIMHGKVYSANTPGES